MNRGLRTILSVPLMVVIICVSANAQPVPVTEVPDNSTNYFRVDDLVYFVSGDALWRTDGTAEGTIALRSGFSSLSAKTPFIGYNGLLYFADVRSSDSYADQWKEVWRSDGTPEGTFRIKASSEYDIRFVGGAGSYYYFSASDPDTGHELYRTDGTAGGTMLLQDINPGAADGFFGDAAAAGSALFFAANDGVAGLELWKTNGSSAGTVMVKDINSGGSDGFGGDMISYNNRLYFGGKTVDSGLDPWISDGTAEGTFRLKDITPWDESWLQLQFKIGHNGKAYFIATGMDDSGLTELWTTGGTSASTGKVKDIGYDPEFHKFLVYQDRVAFFVFDGVNDNLWLTDGTAEGTASIFSFCAMDGGLVFAEVVNDYILFTGICQGYPTSFYRSDGTAAGTKKFADFRAAEWGIYPRDITRVNDLVFYADHDGPSDHGSPYSDDDYYHLFQADGDTTQSMRSLYGVDTRDSDNIVEFNGDVLFTARNDETESSYLWHYDPSAPAEQDAYFTLVNADTDEDIVRLTDGYVFSNPTNVPINVRYNALGTPGSVVFKLDGVNTRTETAAPYSLAGDINGDYAPWGEAKPGTYELTAIPYSEAGGKGTPGEALTITFSIKCQFGSEDCIYTGNMPREVWEGIQGNKVADIPVDTPPDRRTSVSIFEGPSNVGTNYGARYRGYVVPPVTGQYTFWISSNDHSELWLSTDVSQENKARIAWVDGATNPRQWDKFPSQKSATVTLTAGQKYYIEALHKQGVGTDHLAVGWQLPDGTLERPIPGNRIAPFIPAESSLPTVKVVSPTEGQTFTASADILIEAEARDGDAGTIQWVKFYAESEDSYTLLGEDTEAPYSMVWNDVPAGAYKITAYAMDGERNKAGSPAVNIVVEPGSSACGSGTITREYWSGVQGNRVSDIPLEDEPTGVGELTSFEGPSNIGTNYGSRIRGYICPPVTGQYTFWIASNDHSELWLSTSDDPADKQRIAWLTAATDQHQWNKYASQRSAPVTLTAGTRYYIEALHKQGIGTDHIAVAWQTPDGVFQAPIPGDRLSPFAAMDETLARTSDNADADQMIFSDIKVYPNPLPSGARELTISGYGGIGQPIQTDVEIINLTGDVVFTDRIECGGDCGSYLMSVNEHLVPGVYVVKFRTNDASSSRRLLVK